MVEPSVLEVFAIYIFCLMSMFLLCLEEVGAQDRRTIIKRALLYRVPIKRVYHVKVNIKHDSATEAGHHKNENISYFRKRDIFI